MPLATQPRASVVQPLLRLRRMSLWMRALIALGALALVFGTASGWVDSVASGETRAIELSQRAGEQAGVHVAAPLPAASRALINALPLPGLLLGLFALLQAWRLFGAYGRGAVFGPPAVRHLRALAWALVAIALWRIAEATLNVLLLTWHNPKGQRQLTLGVSWEEYACVLFGGLLLAMAWAMTEANRIEQDNAGFV